MKDDPRGEAGIGDRAMEIGPHGFVKLVTSMGSDDLIVEAARCGRQSNVATKSLIDYMMRHRHTSPFEFVKFVFHVSLPIFVARQWMRHRTGVFNEMSARYGELPDRIWSPEQWRGQSKNNHQGSEGIVDYVPEDGWGYYGHAGERMQANCTVEQAAMDEYKSRLNAGVARELARSCLPVSIYTEFYWAVDLHNLFHFLNLRLDPHAQKEIRDYAEIIEKMVAGVVPYAYDAWVRYVKEGMHLSRDEIAMIREEVVQFPSDREATEALDKMKRLKQVPVIFSDPLQAAKSGIDPKHQA